MLSKKSKQMSKKKKTINNKGVDTMNLFRFTLCLLLFGSGGDKYQEYEEAFGESNEETNAYYDMVKEQKFDKLLDKQVQLENAKAQALKQTQNTVNAAGFGSQGYGSSVQSGIYGRYMNAFNENERDYESEVDQLEQARRQELSSNSEEAYQQVVSLMSGGATNMDRVHEYLSSIGLGEVDDDGNFVWGEKPESMSQADWTQLQYLYNLQKDNADEIAAANATPDYAVYGSLDQLGAATYVNSKGNVETLAGHYNEEIKRCWHEASVGNLQPGDTIKITNGEGNTIYLQWTKDGYRMVTASDYNNSEHQYTLTRGKNKDQTWTKVK